MDEKEFTENLSKIIDTRVSELKNQLGSFAKADDLNAQIAEVRELAKNETNFTSINEKLDGLISEFTNLKQRAEQITVKHKSLAELLYEKRELLTNMQHDSKIGFKLRAVIGGGNITSDPNGFTIGDIGELQRGFGEITPLFAQGTIGTNSHGILRYVDVASFTNGATSISKSGTYPATSTLAWQGYTKPLEKIGDRLAMQKESLKDYDFIESQIRMFLIKNIEYKKDYYAILGTGTTPQIEGLKLRATAWAVGDYAAKYKGADLVNFISIIASQIKTSTSEGTLAAFRANTAIVHPSTLNVIKNSRDEFGRLLYPEWLFGANVVIDGVTVKENSLVGVDELYVGDFRYAELYTETPLELEFGYAADTNDWEKDQISLKGMWRGQMLIRNVNQNAFRYVSSITTALSQITKAEA